MLLEHLAAKELVLVTGKGGVGKTAVATALATALARKRPTLLIEADPRESAHRFLQTAPSGGERIQVSPRLELVNLRPERVIDELVAERLPLPGLARRLFRSPVYRHFVEGCPGLKELATLRYAFAASGEAAPPPGRTIDPAGAPSTRPLVVLDSPATGHALSLLSAPELVAEAIQAGPVARLAAEVAGWVGADTTAVVAVTLGEELPVSETVELAERLASETRIGLDFVVANKLYPPVPTGYTGRSQAARLWRARRGIQESELERLARAVPVPLSELPLLALDEGQKLVAALARGLAGDPETQPESGDGT